MYANLKLLKQLEDKVKINWTLAEYEDPFYDDIFTEYREKIEEKYETEVAKPIEVKEIEDYVPKSKDDTQYLLLEPPKESNKIS